MTSREHFTLAPDIVFLNHGSYGACPRVVQEEQSRLRSELELDPVHFFMDSFEELLAEARKAAAGFVGARAEDFAFVRNSTSAVNAVLRSLPLRAGDELLTTNHAYEPCRHALDYAAMRAGATVRVAQVPTPIANPGDVVGRVVDAVTARTRLALIDHVTSPTGLVFPIEDIVRELAARGVDTLVDGAHAPGMLELDVQRIGAAYYAGNFHKWVCAPKGAAMLVVREDKQAEVYPLSISRGYAPPWKRSRFLEEFDWTGTDDPTPWLAVRVAIDWIGSVFGGWESVRRENRRKAIEARRTLVGCLGTEPLAPEPMLGSLAAVALPESSPVSPFALGRVLYSRHGIQVPVHPWSGAPAGLIRISAHVYNEPSEYELLGRALCSELGLAT